MGAPPNEEQLADMLSDPMIAQSMNEALNNPSFIDYMIRMNPQLASMPNAREMLQSPFFRNMLTNPEAIRMAARMRRLFQGGNQAFPAPGATDTTPASGQPQAEGSAAGGNSSSSSSNNNNNNNPLGNLFGIPGGPGAFGADGTNPFTALLGMFPPAGTASGTGTAGAAPASSNQNQPAASPENREGSTTAGANAQAQGQTGGAAPPFNPFTALFGTGQAQGANSNNPFGLPPISPEAMQQMAQILGLGAPGAAAAPPDNRPPEERYAEQLRQLNDMGFFDFDRNVTALRRSGGSVQGAVEYLLSNP